MTTTHSATLDRQAPTYNRRLRSWVRKVSELTTPDPDDVARVEERTLVCSVEEADAGPTNNWMDPAEMKATMSKLYRGCMRGRTMHVVPFCMGPLDAEQPFLGVDITDSAYVVASMKIMARMDASVLPLLDGPAGDRFVPALHSVGAALEPGQPTSPDPAATPRTSPTSRRPVRPGATAPVTAATRCRARSATRCASPSVMAHDEGWWPSTC